MTWPPMWWCASGVPTPRAGSCWGVLKNRLERVQAEFAAKPYEELIQLIRRVRRVCPPSA